MPKRRPGPIPNITTSASRALAAIDGLPETLKQPIRDIVEPLIALALEQHNFNRRIRAVGIATTDDRQESKASQQPRDVIGLGISLSTPTTGTQGIFVTQSMAPRPTTQPSESDAQRILAGQVFGRRS